MTTQKLSDSERRVLRRMVRESDYCGFCYLNFSTINKSVRLGIREVRRACRSLARKGFAEFSTGLFTEDGALAGSGYAATPAGRAALAGEKP